MQKKVMNKVKKDLSCAIDGGLITRNAGNYLFQLFTHELADSVSSDWDDTVNGEAKYTLIYVAEEWEDVSGDYEPEQQFEEHFLYEDDYFSYYHGKCYLDDENTIVGNELMDLEDYWYCWHTVVPKANAVNIPELTKATTTSPKQVGDTNADYKGEKVFSMKEVVVYVSGLFNGAVAGWGFTAVEWKDGVDMGTVCNKKGLSPAEAQHVGAELKATMAGLLWAKRAGYENVFVVYNYEGVKAWVTGEWKAKKPLPQMYQKWVQEQVSDLHIEFIKAEKGWTQWAEALASSAIKEVVH